MKLIPNEKLLEVCEIAARAGGAELLAWQGRFRTSEKSPADLVTDADIASQDAVQRIVGSHFPNHLVVAEEQQHRQFPANDEYCWIVDPLDGTTNYVHGFPAFTVSVAVARGQELMAGVVYDPLKDECYRAVRGGGAWQNEKPIRTSQVTHLEGALAAVSLPPRVRADSADFKSFATVAEVCQAVRRTGSCALNLAYVAAGHLDTFWAHHIHSWDVAAGVLLVREAGGVVTAPDGGGFDLWQARFAAAAGPELLQALLPLIQTHSDHSE